MAAYVNVAANWGAKNLLNALTSGGLDVWRNEHRHRQGQLLDGVKALDNTRLIVHLSRMINPNPRPTFMAAYFKFN